MKVWLRIVPNLRSSLCSKKFQKLNEMLCLNREYSGDLKVNCQGTIFDVHKVVLSCQSDVFGTMLDIGKWKKLETKNGEVKIDDVKGNALGIWICGCKCILASSGSQNSGCT